MCCREETSAWAKDGIEAHQHLAFFHMVAGFDVESATTREVVKGCITSIGERGGDLAGRDHDAVQRADHRPGDSDRQQQQHEIKRGMGR